MIMRAGFWDAPLVWPVFDLPATLAAPQSIVTARYADRGFLSRGTDTPADTLYEARLLSDVDIGQSVVDAVTLGGQVALTVSELEMWNGDDVFNAIASGGRMDGRAIAIRTVPVADCAASDWGGSLAAATAVWMGRVGRVDAQGLRARIALSDVAQRMTTQLQPQLYDGAGGLGGIAELKGLPKPISLGYRFNASPVFLGEVDLGDGALPTYQSHWREIAAHDAVRIRGVAQEAVGEAPGIGQYTDYPALGCFQLGGAPDGAVTCDVRGDAPSQKYAKTIADAIIALTMSLGPGLAPEDFDAQSWFELGPRLAAEIGWGRGTEPMTTAAAVDEILTSSGAWMFGTRAGKLAIALIGSPKAAPDLTLIEPDLLDVAPAALPSDLQPTPQAVEVRAARNWTPLDDVAGSVDADTRAALASEGAVERAFSNAIAARSTTARTLRFEGLYRYTADAQARAAELRTWLERGLRLINVTTDRYLGQVELGHTAHVTYPYYGLAGGWSGTVVAWREKIGARRLELTLIG